MKSLIFFATIMVVTQNALAESVCDIAQKNFLASIETYKEKGGEEFLRSIFKDGPLDGDKRSLAQAQGLNQIEQFFGVLEGSSVLSTKQLGAKSCYLIAILEYKNGPAFAVANYYKGAKGAHVTSMFFKTEPEAILPQEFLVN